MENTVLQCTTEFLHTTLQELRRIHMIHLKTNRHFITQGVSFCEYWYNPGDNIIALKVSQRRHFLETSPEYQNPVLIQSSRLKSFGGKDRFSNVNSTSGLMKANCWRMSSWDNCFKSNWECLGLQTTTNKTLDSYLTLPTTYYVMRFQFNFVVVN